MRTVNVDCCIAGGGPAGMMAGLLLARAGVRVAVLEKHADFFRDFRGDTIHPSTLQMLHEIGLLDEFLKRPHDELQQLSGQVGTDIVTLADFGGLQTACKFIAFMPQWDFLNFLREQAQPFSTFQLLMQTECRSVINENGRVAGVRALDPAGELEIRANLVVAADGRHSIIRAQAGLHVRNLGAPMDVLWMRIPKETGDAVQTLGFIGGGHIVVLIDRKTYWQTAVIIAKGAFAVLRAQPITTLHASIVDVAPFLENRMSALASWDDVSLLEVRVDRLDRWHAPGLLCIGDAAHAMSPIGGVGINLAIQDAVASANLLWEPLLRGAPDDAQLGAVQVRRMFPTRATQTMQVIIQNVVVRAVLRSAVIDRAPRIVRFLTSFRFWRRLMGRLIGLGFRPERIQSPLRAPRQDAPQPDEARSA